LGGGGIGRSPDLPLPFRPMNYHKFNLACLFFCLFFAVANFWVWRNEIARQKLEKITEIENVTKKEIKKEEIGEIKKTEEINKKEIKEIDEEILTTTTIETTIEEVVDEKILPEKFDIQMSFTSQAPEKIWEDPWEDFCEEAAVLMMDAYYKKYNLSPLFSKDELLRIWEWEQNKNFGKSIEIKKIQEILSNYFELKSKIIENPTVEQIKKYLANGQPVLTVADGKVLPNKYFRNGGPLYHALIIHGYDETKFITHDPGSGWSKNYVYEYDVLLNSIHDWNNGKVSEGGKVILVIE